MLRTLSNVHAIYATSNFQSTRRLFFSNPNGSSTESMLTYWSLGRTPVLGTTTTISISALNPLENAKTKILVHKPAFEMVYAVKITSAFAIDIIKRFYS